MELIESLKKHFKYLYLFSAICFLLVGAGSLIKYVISTIAFICIILFPIKFKPLKEIRIQSYIGTILILLFVWMLDSRDLYLALIFEIFMSSIFILYTIDLLADVLEQIEYKNTNELSNAVSVNKLELLVISLTSIVTMTLFSTASPLYKICYWNDSNCFMTVGRGILHGLVPYRDLFEHKGPYLFFIHSLASLISEHSFLGVYIIEVVMCFTYLLFTWKTLKLFYIPKTYSLILIPMVSICLYSSVAFHLGDSAEELCFPLLAIIVYIALKANIKNDLPSNKETLFIGLITGFLFFVKFNFVAMVLGYLLYVVVSSCYRKQLKKLPIKILMFLAGFFVALIPAFIYFLANNAVPIFLESYFYNNLFLYSTGYGPSSVSLIQHISSIFSISMILNKYVYQGLILTTIFMAATKRRHFVLFAFLFMPMFLILYIPTTHMFYYNFILSGVITCSIIPLAIGLDKIFEKSKFKFAPIISLCLVAAGIIVTITSNPNLTLINQPDDVIPQIKFAKEINAKENATILTYDVVDDGFYLYSDTLPNCRAFAYMTIVDFIPELVEEQDNMIANSEFDFIITRSDEYEWDNYEIIDELPITNNRQAGTADPKHPDGITYYLYAIKE